MECQTTACVHATPRRREKASRDAFVLLHGSAGSSALWRALRERLSPLYDTFAPDLIGYGAAQPWAQDRRLTILDEVLRVEGLIPCCDGDFHLVGYSYGGAVALALAVAQPLRIKSLTLIDPVFFAALERGGEQASLDVLRGVQGRFAAGLMKGDRANAMRDFLDFWTGEGAWLRLPERHRQAALGMADKVRLDWEASFAFDPSPGQLIALADRTLLVRGERSPEPMIHLVEALHRLMPGSRLEVITGANHLLPLTHEGELARALDETLRAVEERDFR